MFFVFFDNRMNCASVTDLKVDIWNQSQNTVCFLCPYTRWCLVGRCLACLCLKINYVELDKSGVEVRMNCLTDRSRPVYSHPLMQFNFWLLTFSFKNNSYIAPVFSYLLCLHCLTLDYAFLFSVIHMKILFTVNKKYTNMLLRPQLCTWCPCRTKSKSIFTSEPQ